MEAQREVERGRINSLTATRGLAALVVIIFHFGCEVYPFNKLEHFFRGGNLAVSYFFVLSGFVMSWTYQGRTFSYRDFMQRRAARIFPFYFMALAMSMILPLYYLARYSAPLEDGLYLKLLLNTLFAQAYFPKYALSVNSPGWSLSVEMFFYLLFPFLLKLQERKGRGFIALVVVVYVLSQLLHHYQLSTVGAGSEEAYHFIFYFPLFHLNEFMAGMLGAALFPAVVKRGFKIPAWLVFVLIVAVIQFRVGGVGLHNGLLAPLFLLLILAIAAKDARWMKGGVPVFIGEMSYGLYILQFPLYLLLDLFNRKYFHLSANPFFYVYIGVLLLFTSVTHYTVERPLRGWMLRKAG